MDTEKTTSTKTGMEIIRFQSPTTIWSRHQNIPDDEHDYWESEFRRLEGIPANKALPPLKSPYTFKMLYEGCKASIFFDRQILTPEEFKKIFNVWNIYSNYVCPSLSPIMTYEEFKNIRKPSEEQIKMSQYLKEIGNTPSPSFMQTIQKILQTQEKRYQVVMLIGSYSVSLGILYLVSPIIPISIVCIGCLIGIGVKIKSYFKPKPPPTQWQQEELDYEKWRKKHGENRGLRPGEWDQL